MKKMMRVKNFVETGLLHEVNRLFFHPIGLALEVTVDGDGKYSITGVQDHRDDPEGVVFLHLNQQKMAKAQRIIKRQHNRRINKLGFIYQKADYTGRVDLVLCDGVDQ